MRHCNYYNINQVNLQSFVNYAVENDTKMANNNNSDKDLIRLTINYFIPLFLGNIIIVKYEMQSLVHHITYPWASVLSISECTLDASGTLIRTWTLHSRVDVRNSFAASRVGFCIFTYPTVPPTTNIRSRSTNHVDRHFAARITYPAPGFSKGH